MDSLGRLLRRRPPQPASCECSGGAHPPIVALLSARPTGRQHLLAHHDGADADDDEEAEGEARDAKKRARGGARRKK